MYGTALERSGTVKRSGSTVSGMKGLLVVVGVMVGFIGLLSVVATVLAS